MWWVAPALAGQIIEVRPGSDGVRFDVVGATASPPGEIVNWQGRPLELVIVADFSVSVVVDPEGPATEMREGMLAAYRAMQERPVPGDGLGVTVFAENARRWIPLGALDRPGLVDWLMTFGPMDNAPLPWASAPALKDGEWSPRPTIPSDLGLDAFRTDPSTGVRSAFDELRRSGALKAVVVLWDGEQTVESTFQQLLNRAWSHEIHVFTVAVGDVEPDGFQARGGGDVYIAGGFAGEAIRRIIGQLRMPEP